MAQEKQGIWISGPQQSERVWLVHALKRVMGYDLFDERIGISSPQKKKKVKYFVYNDIDAGPKTRIQNRLRQVRFDLRSRPILVTSTCHPSKAIQGWESLRDHFYEINLGTCPFSRQLLQIRDHGEKRALLNQKETKMRNLVVENRTLEWKAWDLFQLLVDVLA